jgi:protein-arginine kinase activator protein McsA
MHEICDACKSSPAKNHLCEIRDGQMTTFDLCDDCLRARRAATGDRFPILDETQRCYYCGAQAQSGGTNLEWEQRVRGQPFHFTCFRCHQLYHGFITEALASMPTGLSPKAQVEAIAGMVAASDRQVYERVRPPEA